MDNLINETRAYLIENKLIELIGRADLNNGPLTNLTNGGEGLSGYVYPLYLRQIRSNQFKQYLKDNPDFNKGENNSFYGKKHNEQTLELQRQAKRGKNNPKFGKKDSAETRLKKSNKLKAHTSKPEVREERRQRMLGENNPMFGKRWKQSPETCEKKRQAAMHRNYKKEQL